MARPKIEIDTEQLRKLAALHCSVEEMATFFKVHKRTLERRFAAVIEEGRNQGKMSLRRKRFEMALSGNVPLIIFLSKVLLGESDKPADLPPVASRFILVERIDEEGKKIGETHLQTAN